MSAFYLDEDTAIALTLMLRARGHSAAHTHEEGIDRARDYQQLLHATYRGQVLITHNLRDFRLLHGAMAFHFMVGRKDPPSPHTRSAPPADRACVVMHRFVGRVPKVSDRRGPRDG